MTSKTIIIQSETIGKDEAKLGSLLMASFLRVLSVSNDKPDRIVFWNTGVRLVCTGSEVLDSLEKIEEQGIEVLACTTCLNYFNLMSKIEVGKPTDMFQTVETIMNNDIVSL